MRQVPRQSHVVALAAISLSVLLMATKVACRSWKNQSFAFASAKCRVLRPFAVVQPPFFQSVSSSRLRFGIVKERSTLVRLYHSSPLSTQNKKDDDDDDTLVGKAKKLAKSILPTKWFPSLAERNAKTERKRVKQAVKSEIKQVLKDAPLGLRMLGGLIGPILGGLASNLAETAATQQGLVDRVYRQAAGRIQSDSAVKDALGDGVAIGRPFSQSSSSSSINGVTTIRVELLFEVSGKRQRGVGRVVSTGKDNDDDSDDVVLDSLEVQIDGKVLPVLTNRSPKRNARSIYGSSSSNDDNVIEAEIIQKDTKRE